MYKYKNKPLRCYQFFLMQILIFVPTLIFTFPLEYIIQFLPQNPVILDAGAYDGADTVRFATLIHGSTVYSFEPVPALFLKLKEATINLPNTKCFEYALSNTDGVTNFYVSSGSHNPADASSSLLTPKDHLNYYPSIQFTPISVKTIKLDDWAFENNVTHIDFMWLDLQGAEFMILKAAPKILKTVKAIYTEVNLKELYAGSGLYPELRAFLENEGFVVTKEELYHDWGSGNVLFVKKIQ